MNFNENDTLRNIPRTYTGSKKIYVEGSRPDLRVSMREVSLSPTRKTDGTIEENSPITLYDTSGPYTDPGYNIDLQKGLPRLRETWIKERNDSTATRKVF